MNHVEVVVPWYVKYGNNTDDNASNNTYSTRACDAVGFYRFWLKRRTWNANSSHSAAVSA